MEDHHRDPHLEALHQVVLKDFQEEDHHQVDLGDQDHLSDQEAPLIKDLEEEVLVQEDKDRRHLVQGE